MAWLTSEKEKDREIRRVLVTRFVKRLAGRWIAGLALATIAALRI